MPPAIPSRIFNPLSATMPKYGVKKLTITLRSAAQEFQYSEMV